MDALQALGPHTFDASMSLRFKDPCCCSCSSDFRMLMASCVLLPSLTPREPERLRLRCTLVAGCCSQLVNGIFQRASDDFFADLCSYTTAIIFTQGGRPFNLIATHAHRLDKAETNHHLKSHTFFLGFLQHPHTSHQALCCLAVWHFCDPLEQWGIMLECTDHVAACELRRGCGRCLLLQCAVHQC